MIATTSFVARAQSSDQSAFDDNSGAKTTLVKTDPASKLDIPDDAQPGITTACL